MQRSSCGKQEDEEGEEEEGGNRWPLLREELFYLLPLPASDDVPVSDWGRWWDGVGGDGGRGGGGGGGGGDVLVTIS